MASSPKASASEVAGALVLRGTVVSGSGDAAAFVAIPWVRDAVRARVGFDPFPGTLNLLVSDAGMLSTWRAVRRSSGERLTPPHEDECGGRLIAVTVEPAIAAAIVVPDITRHGESILEVLAASRLRTELGLDDGDVVTVTLPTTTPPPLAPSPAPVVPRAST